MLKYGTLAFETTAETDRSFLPSPFPSPIHRRKELNTQRHQERSEGTGLNKFPLVYYY
jgi:hypothetical protein